MGNLVLGGVYLALQSLPVNLARILLGLVAVLGDSRDERTLGVAVLVAAVRPGKLAVDVDDRIGFGGSGSAFIRRQNARARGGDGLGFRRGEEAQPPPGCR